MNRFTSIFHPHTTHGGHVFFEHERVLIMADLADSVEAHSAWSEATQTLEKALVRIHVESGSQFESIIHESCIDPMGDLLESVACVYLKNDAVFAYTTGIGQVYVARQKIVVPLLVKPTFATGRALPGDVYLLTTNDSTEKLQAHHTSWTEVLLDQAGIVYQSTDQIQEMLHELGSRDIHIRALIGVVSYDSASLPTSHEDERIPVAPAVLHKAPSAAGHVAPIKSDGFFLRLKGRLAKRLPRTRRSFIKLIVAIALIVTLVVGVATKVSRQSTKAESEKIAVVSDYVEQQIALATDISSINNARARTLLQDASKSIKSLESTFGADHPDVVALRTQLAQKQAEITNDKRESTEFFDLAVEQAKATGTLMAQSGDTVAILDPAGYVYVLNLGQKSLERRQLSQAEEVVAIAIEDDRVFVLIPDRGIAEIEKNGVSRKVIAKDKNWSNPTALIAYSSNIYVLDPGAGQIFRYNSSESGYSEGSEYFQSDVDIADAGSFAIDGSIYISFPQTVVKYTSGLQDGYNPQFGEEKTVIHAVQTALELDEVYVWDREHGVVQALSKKGAFRFQAASSVLTRAQAIAVYEGAVIALVDSKLYRIALQGE